MHPLPTLGHFLWIVKSELKSEIMIYLTISPLPCAHHSLWGISSELWNLNWNLKSWTTWIVSPLPMCSPLTLGHFSWIVKSELKYEIMNYLIRSRSPCTQFPLWGISRELWNLNWNLKSWTTWLSLPSPCAHHSLLGISRELWNLNWNLKSWSTVVCAHHSLWGISSESWNLNWNLKSWTTWLSLPSHALTTHYGAFLVNCEIWIEIWNHDLLAYLSPPMCSPLTMGHF